MAARACRRVPRRRRDRLTARLSLILAARHAAFVVWYGVAMVRYRSKRDFLHFAVAIEQGAIAMHKWAALERTQVFPVRPVLSLVFVRGAAAALLLLVGLALTPLVG